MAYHASGFSRQQKFIKARVKSKFALIPGCVLYRYPVSRHLSTDKDLGCMIRIRAAFFAMKRTEICLCTAFEHTGLQYSRIADGQTC